MPTPRRTIFSTFERAGLIFLFSASFLFGFFGYREYASENTIALSLSDLLYLTFGLFLVEFSADLGTPIPLTLDIARWLAPTSLSYAAIKTLIVVMHSRIQLWRIHRLSNHAVVCGLSDESLLTVESLRKQGIPTVVIGSIDSARGRLESCGAYMIEGETTDQHLLAQTNLCRASYLLTAASTDRENIEIVYRAFESRFQKKSAPLLHCAVHIESAEIASALCALSVFRRDYENFSASLIHYPKLAARQLLISHGPDSLLPNLFAREKALRILCLGANALIEELIVRFAVLGFYGPDEAVEIQWLGPEVTPRLQALLRQRPSLLEILNLQSLDLNFSALNPANLERFEQCDPDIIYVCASAPEWTLAWSQALANINLTAPVVVFEPSSPFMLANLQREFAQIKHFHFINPLQQACSLPHIFASAQDKLACAIHENYVHQELQKGGDPSTNTSLVPWRELPEALKDANRSQADHVLIKIRLLTGGEVADAEAIINALTPERVEKLARIEHSRWLAEKRISGWRYTSGAKDSAKRLSPALIPWEQLSEGEKQKDRDAVMNLPQLARLAEECGLFK